jgi:hypothetical protein
MSNNRRAPIKHRWLKRIVIGTAAALLVRGLALAQNSYIQPDGSGGYTSITPSVPNSTTYFHPDGAGGYNVMTPGRGNAYIQPDGSGGYNVIRPRPVLPPAMINRFGNGGSVIRGGNR